MNTILIFILVVIFAFVMYYPLLWRYSVSAKEGYWSLPFSGGDVITDNPDPHMIEDETGRVMDRVDMDEGDSGDDYPK